MGTSISQPSPTRKDQGGREWKITKDNISQGIQSKDLLSSIAKSYKSQYGEKFSGKIYDEGVKHVHNFLRDSKKNGIKTSEQFFVSCRRSIASNKLNSFFAEIALGKATSCVEVASNDEAVKKFKTEFLIEVVNYILSRDVNDLLGQPGLVSPKKIDEILNEIRNDLDENISSDTDLDKFLNSKALEA